MRPFRLLALVLALLLGPPLGAQRAPVPTAPSAAATTTSAVASTSAGQTASPAPVKDWRGQLYMRATWLQGKTPSVASMARVDLYANQTSTSLGTYVLQGASGNTLWNLSAIAFAADFTDVKAGTLLTGHVSHVLAYGPYRLGTTATQVVVESWVTAPDTGTPTIAYKINLLDPKKPPTYQGAPFKPLTTLTMGAGYAWIFLPLAL